MWGFHEGCFTRRIGGRGSQNNLKRAWQVRSKARVLRAPRGHCARPFHWLRGCLQHFSSGRSFVPLGARSATTHKSRFAWSCKGVARIIPRPNMFVSYGFISYLATRIEHKTKRWRAGSSWLQVLYEAARRPSDCNIRQHPLPVYEAGKEALIPDLTTEEPSSEQASISDSSHV